MKKVCIDIGHVPGANRSPCVPEYSEGSRMVDLGNALAATLTECFDDVEVFFTRPDVNLDLGVVQRGNAAAGADLFVSLHSNASNNEHCDDINYPLVIYPYDGVNNSTSIAAIFGQALDTVYKLHNVDALRTRITSKEGLRGDYYGVMRGARNVGVPLYFIIEHGFHTNAENAVALLKDEFMTDIVIAEAGVIASTLGLSKREYVPGDVDGDGNVDLTDYAMLKRYILGTLELSAAQLRRADINGDGKVDLLDLATLKRRIMKEAKR